MKRYRSFFYVHGHEGILVFRRSKSDGYRLILG